MYDMPMKLLFPLIVVVVLAACRLDEIAVRQVPKESAPPVPIGGDMPSGMVENPPPAQGLSWTTPAGWKEETGNGMRVATFTPPQESGRSEATVVALPGDAGGELANVNRWRGQIGLTPIDEETLAAARKTVAARAGTILVYDFTGTGTKKSRLVAGMIKVDATTWYFKLMGDADAVGRHKPAFLKLLGGLKHDAS